MSDSAADAGPSREATIAAVGYAASICRVDPDSAEAWAVELEFGGDEDTGDGPQWLDLAEWLCPDSPDEALRPLRQVLDIARRQRVRTIVIEHRYTDPDYRSEYSAFWSKRFEDRDAFAQRLHFFTADVPADRLHNLPDEIRAAYTGYVVLRPTPLGPVGRTVLAPPPTLAGAQLCQVRDRPSLFGSALEVIGVSFCQQDGELLICAHTAAWLCHYVAHNRGIIGRRSTAQIVATPTVEGSPHRPVPSRGLTGEQLQNILSSLGLPAFFYDIADLPDLPVEPPRVDGESDIEHKARISREEVLRVVCKYLNSGFPVIVLTEDGSAHAFTLVGWREDEDGEVVLLACDDQLGPLEEITDVLADAPGGRGPWKSLMIPLPEKVFLTGEAAETGARGFFDLIGSDPVPEDPKAADLEQVLSKLGEWRGDISVRTRLLEGRRYKVLLTRQGRPDDVVRVLRMAHLPHWVWVIEFHDRALRDVDKTGRYVCAEIVLDSTSHDDLPVIDLLATKSGSGDAALERAAPDSGLSDAIGDGKLWRSLITDPALLDDEYLVAETDPEIEKDEAA